MADEILRFDSICKGFFGVAALSEISLGIERGTVFGLVGENGAGKSTLVNILAAVEKPDAGSMLLDAKPFLPADPADAARCGIAFIHQELNLFTNLSILDNLFIDGYPTVGRSPLIDRHTAIARAKHALAAVDLNIPVATLVENLAPGERQLVEIAKALKQDARIFIFDEPTTSLTAKETRRLFDLVRRLRCQGRTVIYISHELRDVLRLADAIAVLRDGRLVSTGPADRYTIDKMISDMVGREITQMYPPRRSQPKSDVVLSVTNLTQSGIVKDISFELCAGEILGLFGLMGSGRTELARIIFGLDRCQSGAVSINGVPVRRLGPSQSIRRRVAFVTENRREEGLLMEASVFDNVCLVSLPQYRRTCFSLFIDNGRLTRSVGDIVDSLKIKVAALHAQPARNLSGGNQQKLVIAKWLLAKPTVLILDEPTRGIDVGAKCEVYSIINGLAAAGTAMLCISSEIEELMGICDRILVMSNGQVRRCFDRPNFDQHLILQAAFERHTDRSHLECDV
jgi:ribose transport system ATP-binding protein